MRINYARCKHGDRTKYVPTIFFLMHLNIFIPKDFHFEEELNLKTRMTFLFSPCFVWYHHNINSNSTKSLLININCLQRRTTWEFPSTVRPNVRIAPRWWAAVSVFNSSPGMTSGRTWAKLFSCVLSSLDIWCYLKKWNIKIDSWDVLNIELARVWTLNSIYMISRYTQPKNDVTRRIWRRRHQGNAGLLLFSG